MRNFLNTLQRTNVIECVNRWRKTAVQAKDLAVNQCREWEIIEQVSEVIPNLQSS